MCIRDRLEDGTILTASNQESEVFPSGMCAERSLLYYLQANFSGVRIVALATASVPGERECYPCGACRQVLADTEKRQGSPIRVVMCSGHSATAVSYTHLDVYKRQVLGGKFVAGQQARPALVDRIDQRIAFVDRGDPFAAEIVDLEREDDEQSVDVFADFLDA